MFQSAGSPQAKIIQSDPWHQPERGSDFIDVDQPIAVARRQWRVVAAAVGVALALGGLYILTAVPAFTASTTLLIDENNGKLVDQLRATRSVLEEEASILSQVELLKSDKIGLMVVDRLNLTENKPFMSANDGVVSQVKGAIRDLLDFTSWFSEKTLTEEEKVQALRLAALSTLHDNADVSRVGKTYLLELSYSSPDPRLATRIAHEFAEVYLVEQLDSKFDATRRAGGWIQQRVEELRQKSLASDLAVERFRAANGLLMTDGVLVTDRNLSELNSQLVTSQAETGKAQAQYNRIKSIIDSRQIDAAVTESLQNPVINSLREKFLETSKRQAEIAGRLGVRHIQAVRLSSEMAQYQRLLFDELGRIAESYRNEVQVAKAREQSIRDNVASAAGVSTVASETGVQMRELIREADSYKSLYQTFLQKAQEAASQQSFPVAEGRIVSEASIPNSPSSPRVPLVLALSVMLGGAVGVGVAGLREFRERFFRTGSQVRDDLGLQFFGIAPVIAAQGTSKRPRPAAAGIEGERMLTKLSPVSNYVVDHPLSPFGEALRSVKVAADTTFGFSQRSGIIGVISVLPNEGKSTVAVNFAELLAIQGAETLLIDADLRNPGLTRSIAPGATAGLLEAIADPTKLDELLHGNAATGLAFLPAVVKSRGLQTSQILASPEMAALLAEAGKRFRHIIIDLPPLAPVVDARAVASRIDAFLLVVEWGKTPRRLVRTTLQAEAEIEHKCLGVILNKVDMEKMKLYQTPDSSESFYSRFSPYYADEAK